MVWQIGLILYSLTRKVWGLSRQQRGDHRKSWKVDIDMDPRSDVNEWYTKLYSQRLEDLIKQCLERKKKDRPTIQRLRGYAALSLRDLSRVQKLENADPDQVPDFLLIPFKEDHFQIGQPRPRLRKKRRLD